MKTKLLRKLRKKFEVLEYEPNSFPFTKKYMIRDRKSKIVYHSGTINLETVIYQLLNAADLEFIAREYQGRLEKRLNIKRFKNKKITKIIL